MRPMRSDFLGDCDRFAGLPEAMNRSQYLVPRLTHLNEVADICGCADAPQRVLDVLARFRQDNRNFVVLSSEKVADNPLIDISHESLIRQWPTLNQWVAAEADSAAIYRRLADTAQLHAKGKASLYRDALESTSVGPLLGPDNIKNALACRWFSLAVDIYRGGVYDVAFSADGKTWPAALPKAPSGSGISKPINFFYHPTNPRPCCMPLPPAFVL